MSQKSEIAVEKFNSMEFNCAQAVFLSYSEEYGLDTLLAKKICGAFVGGIANNGEICGAVVGALMLISLKYGQNIEGDISSIEKIIKITNNYIQKFKKEFGSIICRDLLKFDLSIQEESIKASLSGVFKKLCPIFVKKSVEIVEEYL
jgi:C_GCAxxG_C_C family probable redox protein